jgi:hypothetical protein
VPSACLNSTVSGLVSRTVLNDRLIGPGQFHGAKFYADLAPADVSGRFLDAVSARFDDVRTSVAAAVAERARQRARDGDRVSWAGWAAVERISAQYGVGDVNLVKPGVGEATRVLLRRVPWRVLVRTGTQGRGGPDGALDDLAHIRLLAAQRGVPVEVVPDLAYSCVGLIRPSSAAARTRWLADGTDDRQRVAKVLQANGLPDGLVDAVSAWATELPPRLRGSGPLLAATDLDRTLIFSRRAARLGAGSHGFGTEFAEPPDLVAVETRDGSAESFVTRAAAELIRALDRCAVLVPVTTRTRAQYARVQLPARPPAYAVTSNGGHLLVAGVPCPDWSAEVARRLAAGSAPLDAAVDWLRGLDGTGWLHKRRVAEDLFVYLVVERKHLADAPLDAVRAWCADHGWVLSVQGRKLYLTPAGLTKEAAVAEVAARTGAAGVLAAGDSLLDLGLLACADAAIRPAHGELHDAGLPAELPGPSVAAAVPGRRLAGVRVTQAAGALAGEQIAGWLLALAAAALA